MKTNIFSIRSKILALAGVILLFWIVYGIIVLSNSSRYNALTDLQKDLLKNENRLTELQEDYISFLKSDHGEDFFASTDNENTAELKENLVQYKLSLDSLAAHNYFFYHSGEKESIENMQDNLKGIKTLFLDMIKLQKDLGNENYGLISEWISSNNELLNAVSLYNDPFLQNSADEMITAQNAFLEEGKAEYIDEITRLKNQVNNYVESTIMPEDTLEAASDITSAASSFSESGNRVLQEKLEIGLISNSGLFQEMDEQFSESINQLNNLQSIVHSEAKTVNKRGRSFILWFWIAFTILTGLILFYHYIEIKKPFYAQKDFIDHLSNGEFPEPIATNQKNEFNYIFEKLGKFVQTLRNKAGFTEDLANGKADSEMEPISEHDKLGHSLLYLKSNLLKAREEEEKHRLENERRRWINEGIAQLAEVLRQNNDNLTELSFEIVVHLVKYLKAAQGGIFLYNDQKGKDPVLELSAAFAFNRRKYHEKTIALGEGLVGTCAIEKKTIFLKEIPEDYLEITSGLGDSRPASILVVPLNIEGNVLGVVELASFEVFKDYEIEFIEKIAENVASTLTSVRINQRTATLLEQSQSQAAEMREKEEEMRQNMEELQATQEESARRENEINSILTAINSTSLVVEYDMDGNIIHINERFLNILEMSRSDVINTHHSVFTSKNSAEGSYQTFWEKLRNGESITNVEVIKLLNGKKLWLNQTYSPILNLEDIPYKVINIAQDISERKLKEQEIEKHKQTLQFKNNELESINMAINESVIKCEMSPDGKLLSANNNYAQVIGKPLSDVIGKNFLEMLQNEEKEFHDSIWPKLLMNQSYKGVVKRIRSNGEELWIMSTFTPVTDDKNEVYKIYFLGQNITEQKQKFQLLVDANKEIEKLHNLLKQNNIEIPGDD